MYRAALILLLSSGGALAHPHHGAGGWLFADLLHLLTEPDHLALMLVPAVAGASWLLAPRFRRRILRRAQGNAGRSRKGSR